MADSKSSELDKSLLETILEGTASETGEEFLAALVRSLAKALRVDAAWVTEYFPAQQRLRALSFWYRNDHVLEYEYDLRGTPCASVLQQKCLVRYPENVIQLFPDDPDLTKMQAVGYMGIPILDESSDILGHLAVLDSQPMPPDPQLEAVFRIFAVRAAAELRRLRAESRTRESELRFSRLFESAMDAIVELDDTFRICKANRATLDALGIGEQDAAGLSFLEFLTESSAEKLQKLTRSLEKSPSSRVWVPAGFEVLRTDGTAFPAEASLARFEVGRDTHFTLILRNIH
jgi:PAS domain S-box-containing protein